MNLFNNSLLSNKNLINILCIILVSILVYFKGIINGNFTCKNYILNAYSYILLSILIFILSTSLYDKNIGTDLNSYYKFSILAMILSFAMIFAFIFTNNIYLSHIFWLIFILSISYILIPLYRIMINKNVFNETLITAGIMVFIITLFAFIKPELISLKMGPILLILLIVGLILRIVQFISGNTGNRNMNLVFSYVFVVLFSLFLMYDTKLLQVKAQYCNSLFKNGIKPNYPRESMKIFLDLINLFTNLGSARLNI